MVFIKLTPEEKKLRSEQRKQKTWKEKHKIIEGIIYKQCTKCQEWKPETIDYFYMRNKSKPDRGFNAECIECSKDKARIYERNHKEEQKENFNEWYLNNKKRNYKRGCKWKENNKEYYTEIHRKWLNENPDKTKQYQENRQHKNHKITKQEWKSCKEYFNNQCAYCGLPIKEHYYTRLGVTKLGDFHKEHVNHEGSNDLSNCVPSCGRCNSSKHKAILEYWYNLNNPNYTQERYDKIMNWITEDYKQYIEEQKPKKGKEKTDV